MTLCFVSRSRWKIPSSNAATNITKIKIQTSTSTHPSKIKNAPTIVQQTAIYSPRSTDSSISACLIALRKQALSRLFKLSSKLITLPQIPQDSPSWVVPVSVIKLRNAVSCRGCSYRGESKTRHENPSEVFRWPENRHETGSFADGSGKRCG